MRVRLGLVALMATALVLPTHVAAADGGAFIDFGGTFYTPGGSGNGDASGKAFVSVPQMEQDILDRGPFYAYLLPYGRSIREGESVPDSAIRVGTFTVDHLQGKVFVLRVSFAVPDVESGMYSVSLCNDPCTVAGFREPLTGTITIGDTAAEAKLATQLQAAQWNIDWLQTRVRKLKEVRLELEAELEGANIAHAALQSQIDELEAAPVPSATTRTDSRRPLAEGWALLALGIAVVVALTSIVLAIVFARQRDPHTPFVVPDTIAELDKEREDTLART
jgi:hypothetical protein